MTQLTRLYPDRLTRPLAGTYLAHELRDRGAPGRPFVYTNFIASLDGRIALRDARTRRYGVPRAIANDDDWRLFLELAAQADAVVTSARRLRELAARGRTLRCVSDLAAADLAAWRRARQLPPFPACIVLSTTLNLPYDALRALEHDEIIVVSSTEPTPTQRRALDDAGVTVAASGGGRVRGDAVLDVARRRGYRTLYAIGGPKVFHTLLADHAMHRVYLTHSHRLLAGEEFDTLLEGSSLAPPAALTLHELHLFDADGDAPQMLFASYDVATNGTARTTQE